MSQGGDVPALLQELQAGVGEDLGLRVPQREVQGGLEQRTDRFFFPGILQQPRLDVRSQRMRCLLVQDLLGKWWVCAAIVVGAVLSAAIASTTRIAVASGVAFLVSEFLDFARVRATHLVPLDIHAVVVAVVRLIRAHPDCRPDAVIAVEGDRTILDGDEDLLHRVIANLVLIALLGIAMSLAMTALTQALLGHWHESALREPR